MMTENDANKKWRGILRKDIEWFPSIDEKKCQNCMVCVDFCRHGVYREENGKAIIVKPYNCVVGCVGCDSVCPKGAISHPSQKYLADLENSFKAIK